MEIKEEERIDDLQIGNLKLIQNKEWFCFGIDSILLSNFAKEIKKDERIIDLGCGNGILELLFAKKSKAREIIGIEVQEDVYQLAKRNVEMNHLQKKIKMIHANVKNLNDTFPSDSFDAVISNPPYMKKDTGKMNEKLQKLIARHEIEANLDDFIKISFYLLKDKRPLYMIYRTERLTDMMEILRKYKIEPKEIQFIHAKMGNPPELFLIKAVKNGKPYLKVKKPLIIYQENGDYTEEILKIYGKVK